MLKRISQSVHPHEVEIAKIFAAEPLASHPRNHCSPLYEVLIPPGEADNVILVTPFLRAFDDPPFDSIGEIVEFFRQVFEVRHLTAVQCGTIR